MNDDILIIGGLLALFLLSRRDQPGDGPRALPGNPSDDVTSVGKVIYAKRRTEASQTPGETSFFIEEGQEIGLFTGETVTGTDGREYWYFEHSEFGPVYVAVT